MTAAEIGSAFRVGSASKVFEQIGSYEYKTEEQKPAADWKDCIEGMLTCLDWIFHFSSNEENKVFAQDVKNQLEPVKLGFAIPQLFTAANSLRHSFEKIGNTDDSNLGNEIFAGTALTALHGSETVQFFESLNIISLRDAVKDLVKGVFWGAALILDGGDVYTQIKNIDDFDIKIETESDIDIKSIYEHKRNIAHLKILKNVITVAMASLALVSILFASLVHGFLFSPLTFLFLGTAYIVLQFAAYFYEEAVKVQVKDLNQLGKRV